MEGLIALLLRGIWKLGRWERLGATVAEGDRKATS